MCFFQEERPIILVFWSLKLGQMHNLVNFFHPMSHTIEEPEGGHILCPRKDWPVGPPALYLNTGRPEH